MRPQGRNVKLPSNLIVPIVGEGAIAGRGVAEGRLVPVAIVDARLHPRVSEFIRAHSVIDEPGDVQSQWSSIRNDKNTIALHLWFSRPIELECVLLFDIQDHAILVDALLRSQAIYIQAGEPGDVPSGTMDEPRVFIEIPAGGFRPVWDQLLEDRMTVVMAHETGLSRRKARPLAVRLIQELAKVTDIRMR